MLFLFGDHLDFPESVDELAVILRGYGDWAWAAGVALIVGDAVLPLPSDPTIFTLGLIYGPWQGALIGGSAATVGGLIGYGITRMLGERGARLIVGERDLERARVFYDRWGLYAVALGRALGGPAEYVVVLAGLSKMPFRSVLLAIATGAFSSALVMAILGSWWVAYPVASIVVATGVVCALVWVGARMIQSAEA